MKKIISDMPFEQYLAVDAASNSILSKVRVSPAHCWEYMNRRRESTEAQVIGQAVHCLVLEPESFPSRFAEAPEVDRRTKVGKDLWTEFCQSNPGKTILKIDHANVARSVSRAILGHETARVLLAGIHPEMSIFWDDRETQCKARVDAWNAPLGVVCDLKTTTNASARFFERQIIQLGYYRQAAWYMRGMRACGLEPKSFVFIAVEKEAPFGVSLFSISRDLLSVGDDENVRLLEIFAKAKREDVWPGYPTHVQAVSVPAWMTGGPDSIEEF